jgi:hypothetical protein
MSYKTRVVFTVKEADDGHLYLMMEFHDDIPGLPADPPFFDLMVRATMEEAELVATFLNAKISYYRPFPLAPKNE